MDLLDTPQNPLHRSIQLSEEKDRLLWPVCFLYPEYGQTEYIESFDEYAIFEDHLRVMFSGDSPAPWDLSRTYNFESIEVLYEDQRRHRLVPVPKSTSLLEILQKEG